MSPLISWLGNTGSRFAQDWRKQRLDSLVWLCMHRLLQAKCEIDQMENEKHNGGKVLLSGDGGTVFDRTAQGFAAAFF